MACIMVLHVATAVFYSRSRKVLERSAFQCTVKMILAAFSIETRGFRIRMVTLQQMGSVLASRASHIYLIYTLSHVKWTIARSSTHLWRFHEKRSFVSIGIRTFWNMSPCLDTFPFLFIFFSRNNVWTTPKLLRNGVTGKSVDLVSGSRSQFFIKTIYN